MNVDGFNMMFLEETNWRESYIISFHDSSSYEWEELSKKCILNFYIRSYKLEIEKWPRVVEYGQVWHLKEDIEKEE